MNQNNNECNQSHYSQYLSLPNLANMAVMPKFGEYAIDPAANMKVDFQASQNIDSLLQIHRRKMLRRAANRRSAQLSRARKKVRLLFVLGLPRCNRLLTELFVTVMTGSFGGLENREHTITETCGYTRFAT